MYGETGDGNGDGPVIRITDYDGDITESVTSIDIGERTERSHERSSIVTTNNNNKDMTKLSDWLKPIPDPHLSRFAVTIFDKSDERLKTREQSAYESPRKIKLNNIFGGKSASKNPSGK